MFKKIQTHGSAPEKPQTIYGKFGDRNCLVFLRKYAWESANSDQFDEQTSLHWLQVKLTLPQIELHLALFDVFIADKEINLDIGESY